MKGRNVAKKVMCLAMAAALGASAMAASGCSANDPNTVKFWFYGNDSQIAFYRTLVEEFNNTYGAEHGIKVKGTEQLSGTYQSTTQTKMNDPKTGPDVVLTIDNTYKTWLVGNMLEPLDDLNSIHTDIDMGTISTTVTNRLRYNVATNTSNETDSLYAMPLEVQSTALFFNKGLMERAGIIVISVDEDKLDDWNNNAIADNYGKKKSDYAKLNGVTVPKKGYYRSENPYHLTVTAEWEVPASSEVLVFNNRIAMNWDEVEDLAALFAPSHNPGSKAGRSKYDTTYGYFTETWFNYGWSVGGDCLYDLTGHGDYAFGLLDPNPNYIVKDDATFTINGTTYNAGETIAFADKMNVDDGETLVPDTTGDFRINSATGETAGISDAITAEMAKGESSALKELPSMRDAFGRYLRLGLKDAKVAANKVEEYYGFNVSPNPASITDANPIMRQFYSGDILMYVGSNEVITELHKYENNPKLNSNWDVAPIVRYKEYTDPTDPDCDDIKVEGVEAGHNRVLAMGLAKSSTKKDAAKAFIKWASGLPGQTLRAKNGFIPTQPEALTSFTFNKTPQSIEIFTNAMAYQRPGDWWYMPNTAWSTNWATPLNSSVRNGKMSYEAWKNTYVQSTNNILKNNYDFKK